MSTVSGTSARKGAAVVTGGSWGICLVLLVLLPIFEWVGISWANWVNIPPSPTAAWAGMLVADSMVLALLWWRFGTEIRAKLHHPTLVGVGWTVLAFLIGWMVVPMAQFGTAPLAGLTPTVGGPGVSLVPDGQLELVLLAMAATAGALVQECLYRGILWDRVTAIAGNEWVTVGISSLLFGSLFWYAGMPTLLSVGVAWGLVAALLYKFTRNLGLVIALNALNVFFTYALLFKFWM